MNNVFRLNLPEKLTGQRLEDDEGMSRVRESFLQEIKGQVESTMNAKV